MELIKQVMNLEIAMKKPLLLIFPLELLAHYLRCLTLATELSPYFEIRFAYSRRYKAFIQDAGFATFPCDGIDVDEMLDYVKQFDFSWINIRNLENTMNSQVAAIELWKPALVLGDAIPTLKMSAEKTGVPYISLMNGYMSKHYAGVRKMSWRYPLFACFKFLPEVILDKLTKTGERLSFQKIHQPFKELRQQHGLLKKFCYPDEMEGDLNLICDLPELFPQRALPANYHLVPPLIYQPNVKTDEISKKLHPDKKTIFVSMGSTGDWSAIDFLNEAVFEKYNIITAGDASGIVRAPHIIRAPFVNIHLLFKQVDLVMCHGGNGTVYQALLYGIPLLCKTVHFEQEWNVQALEKQGLGKSLDAIHFTKDYEALFDEWSRKKGSEPFKMIQQKIRLAFEHFESPIEALLHLAFHRDKVVLLPKHKLAQ